MRGTRRWAAALLVALAVLAAACSDGTADDDASPTTTTTAEPTTSTTAPPAEPQPVRGPWERVDAPSTCRCSDGSPYHLYVRRADPARVVFYLEGGGACFSADTCGPGNPTYTRDLEGREEPAEVGIFADDERNPFAGWSMVYVPYCTGDLHLGDQVQDYGDGVVVRHNGAVNASTALTAMAAAFPDAAQVVVAGSSAGSASAPLYGGLAHDLLPDADVTVVADASGAYPRDEVITSAIGALWGAFQNLPDWPTSAGEPETAWSLPGLFVRAGRHVPDLDVATLNNAYDDVQARFSALIGNGGDLREKIVENDEWIESQGVEVRSWVAPGTGHTILGRPDFYDAEVDGVQLHEWLAGVVADEDVPDVRCTECR
ncbi:MAG: pectin acetylesterase-family hydrolase [Acidimicrobiia bacterium]